MTENFWIIKAIVFISTIYFTFQNSQISLTVFSYVNLGINQFIFVTEMFPCMWDFIYSIILILYNPYEKLESEKPEKFIWGMALFRPQ
jgi:hypothetical protein